MVTPTLSQRADAVDEKIGEVESRLQTLKQKFDAQEAHLKTIAEKIGSQESTIERAVQAAVAGVLEAERKRTEGMFARTTTRLEERIDRFRIEHERLAAIERENNEKFREEVKRKTAGGQGTRPPIQQQPVVQPINLDAEGSHNHGLDENEIIYINSRQLAAGIRKVDVYHMEVPGMMYDLWNEQLEPGSEF
uniref:Uncharacterized protein n=1 Tax=Chenopodium quinoa TaxID=63459 RepID=A0A803LHR2_CHEQI